MSLKTGLTGNAATLRTHMGSPVLMDPLVRRHAAPVRQHHWWRAKHTGLRKEETALKICTAAILSIHFTLFNSRLGNVL